jgi:hypothetical protein
LPRTATEPTAPLRRPLSGVQEPGVEINRMFRLVTDDVLGTTDHHQRPFVYGSLAGEDEFFFRPGPPRRSSVDSDRLFAMLQDQ